MLYRIYRKNEENRWTRSILAKKNTPRRKKQQEPENTFLKHQTSTQKTPILGLPSWVFQGCNFKSLGKLGITCGELVTWSSFHLKKNSQNAKKLISWQSYTTQSIHVVVYIYIPTVVRYTLITKTSRNSTSILKCLSFLLWKKPPCLAQLHIRKVFG